MIHLNSPADTLLSLREKVKSRRLDLNMSRKTLSEKSGVPMETIRRFEVKGKISLESFVKLCFALGEVDELSNLFTPKQYKTLEEMEKANEETKRKRGRN